MKNDKPTKSDISNTILLRKLNELNNNKTVVSLKKTFD